MNYSYKNLTLYIPKAVGVKEFAYDEDVNIPYRKDMEDSNFFIILQKIPFKKKKEFFITDNILQDGSQSILFGILDGHGGRQVAEFVQKEFEKLFVHLYKQYAKNIYALLEQCFIQIDEIVRQHCKSDETGTTATIGFIRLESCKKIHKQTQILKAKRVLYVANVGDSKGFVFDDKTGIQVTQDHKPSNPSEVARIKSQGGAIYLERVGGVLAVSRAIGDNSLKPAGVICRPDLIRIELRLIHKWLIFASDGLWDVMNEKIIQDIIDQIRYKETADEVSKYLVKKAIQLESRDNISVLCLKLN